MDQKTLQEIANNAWPAKLNYLMNGWIIRIDQGVTYRANSVLPLSYWGKDLELDVAQVETVYRSFNLSSKFMLHDQYEPVDLKSVLSERTYEEVMPTFVLGIEIKKLPQLKPMNQFQYKDTSKRLPVWFPALLKLSSNRTSREMAIIGSIMDRVELSRKKFFFTLDGEEIIGVLLAIYDREFLGVMNLVVNEKYRKLGIATQLMMNAIEWGGKKGAKYLYLQVEKSNKAAISLYQKFHMKKWYSYSYFEKNRQTDNIIC